MSDSVASDERLKQINQELSLLLEEKLEFLTRMLSETQRYTQKIAGTELEIQRNSAQHARLESEQGELAREVEALHAKVDEAAAARDAQQQEKYAREKELQRIEWEIADLRRANEEFNGKIRALEAERTQLQGETQRLEQRSTKLEEGVLQIRRLREELLAKVAQQESEMGAVGKE